MKKLTTEEFIEKAKEKHGNRFCYDKTVYDGYHTKTIIKCNNHNLEFEQVPSNHLNGNGGCRLCQKELAIKTNECFIEEVTKKHNGFYNYDKVDYIGAHKKVIVTCPIHGDFETKPNDHIKGDGCFECGKIRRADKNRYTNEKFIQKAKKIHNNKYNYSLCNYYDSDSIVTIICKLHGNFNIRASQHLSKYGCQKCGQEKRVEKQKENPTGWNLTSWKSHGEISKEFESYKCYIIRCWNEEEEFYKIGRTFKNIHKRFKCESDIPYNYEVIYLFEGKAEDAYYSEVNLKRTYKPLKYVPSKNFGGRYECFTTELPIEEIISYLNSL